MARPISELIDPVLADPQRRARIEEGVKKARSKMHANRLAEFREAQGVGQQQLAERLSISQAAISKLENSADPKLSTLIRYAEGLGANLSVEIRVEGAEPIRIAG